MNSNGILHISVNGKGRVRTWESPQECVAKKDPDEVAVQLSLTKPQIALVLRAEGLSRQKETERLPHTSSAYLQYVKDGVVDPRD